jgi:DNA topoisomerase VI subunit A
MRYLITTTLLLIALNSYSQTVTKKDSVCLSFEVAAQIMADLQRLEVCMEDVSNKNEIISASIEKNVKLGQELAIKDQNIKRLTEKLNDTEAKNRQLKRKRIWWGVAGVAVGAVGYSLLK